MLVLCSVLLVWMMNQVWSHSWIPCTDLAPLDLLDQSLAPAGQALPPQVHVVQSRGSRGLRLDDAVGFPASQIFIGCDRFPAEFSLVVTLKVPRLRSKTNHYIFSLLKEGSDSLLLRLSLSKSRLQLLTAPPAGQSRLNFKDILLDDNRWHTLILAVSGPHASLRVDCGPVLELTQVQSFPNALRTSDSHFIIGSRGTRRGFSGLLRQLVLVPGSDASSRLCPSQNPELSALSVPHLLLPSPSHKDTPYVSTGPPPCSRSDGGRLWFSSQIKTLFLCDGNTWNVLLHNQQRLDYVEDYQDVLTLSETFDVEVFSIPSEGLFMAAANRDSSPGSGIYRWSSGSFKLYQNISTEEARAWRSFSIQGQMFLVVANFKEAEQEVSVIYRWNKRRKRFLRFQTLETHSALDWEAFNIYSHSFLIVANHRRGSEHNIHSVIYRWDPDTQMFQENQTLSTSGAYDWEFFTAGSFHFLAVANTFDGRTTVISSTVYVWLDGRFQTFQNIPTVGATDWESFEVDGRVFLVVANSQLVSGGRPPLYTINSTVYELSMLTHTFIYYQDILTHSAVDWEFFTVGDQKFLVVANSHDGSSYSLNSVIYRWKGYEGFVAVHSLPTIGCTDWEHFTTEEGSFLLYSSATSRLSKVFRLRTY
ncbi:thrombospondin-type laminin G domain and EAR repeat-containing protein-like isoform X2 [Gouania willdenowi]|uniref:Thrombospondin-type laminin G domain and EAR repeat-containing protein-like n=1 Tax=Gouania willdenowi TaxID=441366 RepID=A0A8C5DU59_GOUWI|nr:thrombospondin-type laminin G domain and EAR repeat-containing protein-like isoform X2 [Gouania willdenowi]